MFKIRERLQAKSKQKRPTTDSENEKCIKALDQGRYDEAIIYGKKALELVPANTPLDSIAPLWYNIGLALEKYNPNTALRYYTKAEPFFKGRDMQDLIHGKINCHIATLNFDAAKDTAKVLGGRLAKLEILKIKFISKEMSSDDIEKKRLSIKPSSGEEIVESIIVKMYVDAKRGDVNNIQRSMDVLSKLSTPLEVRSIPYDILNILRVEGRIEEGLHFLNLMKKKYPNIGESLDSRALYNLFIIHELSENYDAATTILKKIHSLSHLGPWAAMVVKFANEERFYTEVARDNFDEARKILKSTDLNHDLYNKMLTKLAQDSIQNQARTTELKIDNSILSNAIIEAEQHNHASEPAIENADQDRAVEIEQVDVYDFDPKKIHEYFQHKKSLIAKKEIDTALKSSSWILSTGTKYTTAQTNIVHKVEGREHYYICIKNNLKLGVDFIKAMKKGVVSKAHYSTGIKFFKNADSVECMELKINGGDRAWSKTMYANPEGNYLIIIDGYGNHVTAGKAARTGMEIIAVTSDSSPAMMATKGTWVKSAEDYHYTTTSSEYKDHTDAHHDDLDLMGNVSAH